MYKGWIWLPKARKGDIWIGLNNVCRLYQTGKRRQFSRMVLNAKENFTGSKKVCGSSSSVTPCIQDKEYARKVQP